MRPQNVLIVEDDKAVQEMMQDVLELQGFRVFIASDGAEGIERLREIAPEPCVILLDLMMPKANGWQFLEAQRSDPKLAEYPVVICSAYPESAKSLKPKAYVPKPIQFNDLLSAVKSNCA
ncbi:MAG TPA: response regulator [Bdellovibrionales bacterium]|nr:response regulator [Bdellovibrionales bacterium]